MQNPQTMSTVCLPSYFMCGTGLAEVDFEICLRFYKSCAEFGEGLFSFS